MATVFVDLDLTLVNTRKMAWWGSKARPTEKQFWYDFRRFGTMARPGAIEFLRTLTAHYEVHILTYGNSRFQSRVLKEVGLLDCVPSVYGVDNWDTLTKPEHFVLIDDMPRNSLLIRYKMDWLGKNRFRMTESEYEAVLDKHHIQCVAFDGTVEAESLVGLVPTIHRYLKPSSSG